MGSGPCAYCAKLLGWGPKHPARCLGTVLVASRPIDQVWAGERLRLTGTTAIPASGEALSHSPRAEKPSASPELGQRK